MPGNKAAHGLDQTVGHYKLLERLGGAALGDVFRARDTKVGRTVALIQAPADLLAVPARRSSFLEAARTAARLNHPNIATLFDIVEQGGGCYLAYEFTTGPSLRQEMGGTPMNLRRALDLAAQIADAVAEGHARGVVHGDLRPETVVVTPKGSAKILHFGMTPWTSGGAARLTAAVSPDMLSGEAAQVVPYLSPEQTTGSSIDTRSDLFSLGTMLYEMLTGRNPFAAATASATVRNVVRLTPPELAIPGENTRELQVILAKALAKDRDERFQSAAAFAAELRKAAAKLDARDGEVADSTMLIPIEEDRHDRTWWFAALLAIALIALWWYWQRA
jgi:serine/threonine protein kinase